MVLVTKKQIREVYAYLLDEGVLVVKKDIHAPRHIVFDIPNTNVMNIMKTLKSKHYVTEVFCWNWHYYTVTDEGIEFLKNYLGAPSHTLPKSRKVIPRKKMEEEKKEGEAPQQRRGKGRGEPVAKEEEQKAGGWEEVIKPETKTQ